MHRSWIAAGLVGVAAHSASPAQSAPAASSANPGVPTMQKIHERLSVDCFGRRSLDLCRPRGLPPFHLGAAHEALARAASLRKDTAAMKEHLAAGRRALGRVTDAEERMILKADLDRLESPAAERGDK